MVIGNLVSKYEKLLILTDIDGSTLHVPYSTCHVTQVQQDIDRYKSPWLFQSLFLFLK
jgi:hypothetical protein